jgi:hypothetical protein
LWEEKQQRKIAEKLALQREKECLAKNAEDNKKKISLLLELIQTKLGGDIDALLASNLEVPLSVPSLSTPAPSLPRVSSIAFPLAGRASGL